MHRLRGESNCLVLMAQSPYTLFVYWTISPSLWEMLADKGEILIRLYRQQGGNSEIWGDVPVWSYARTWYIGGIEAGGSYYAEMGYRSQELAGGFVPVLRSNPVQLPWDRGKEAVRRVIEQNIKDEETWLIGRDQSLPREVNEKTAPVDESWWALIRGMAFYMGIVPEISGEEG